MLRVVTAVTFSDFGGLDQIKTKCKGRDAKRDKRQESTGQRCQMLEGRQ